MPLAVHSRGDYRRNGVTAGVRGRFMQNTQISMSLPFLYASQISRLNGLGGFRR